jgi:glucose-1-phosphate thymidylyltransferase
MRTREIIGLIPCGGRGTRIAPLPCSKEVLPVGIRQTPDGSFRPKVVSHYLLEKMSQGGVHKAFFILRKGKWDIPEYYGDGAPFGMDLGYLIVRRPYGPAYTLDQAYPFVRGARVALGFPDILFEPPKAFGRALERLEVTRTDLVLGLYRAHDIRVWDVVAVDRTGRVRELLLKPDETKSKLGWVFAVWTSRFTEFMHEYLAVPRTAAERPGTGLPAELTVGEVLQAAVREGLPTQSVVFPRHDYLDIGTPEGLRTIAAGSGLKCLHRIGLR